MSEAISKADFQNWMKTARQAVWNFDHVIFHNRGEYLLYSTGSEGVYLWIREKTAEIGTFEDAYQFITDGSFHTLYDRTFDSGTSFSIALSVLEKLGLSKALVPLYATYI